MGSAARVNNRAFAQTKKTKEADNKNWPLLCCNFFTMSVCLFCKQGTPIKGCLIDWRGSGRAEGGARFLPRGFHESIASYFGLEYVPNIEADLDAYACLNCGLVLAHVSPAKIIECFNLSKNAPLQGTSNASDTDSENKRTECLGCRDNRIMFGDIQVEGPKGGWGEGAIFCPDGVKWFTFTPFGPGTKLDPGATACGSCGLLRARVDPMKLKEFIMRHCKTALRPS
jgi:hypothetical protein